MRLQEIFDQLSHGEFSQISIGGQLAGVINEANYERVLNHINLGLTALFTRFNLKERRITVPLQADADTYLLEMEDILKINKIVTDDDVEVALNQEGNAYSCFTPSLNILRVPAAIVAQGSDLPDDLKTEGLTVVYRANHPRMAMRFGILNPQSKVVDLPSSHLMALLYFVASRAHNPVGMVNEFNAGNSWYAKYEHACQELEVRGLQVEQVMPNYRLQRAGWV